MKWVNLTDGVNLDYLEQRKLGDILGFVNMNQGMEDKRIYYKIVRIDKKRNKYWAKQTDLLTERETEQYLNGLKRKDVKDVKDVK